MVSDQGIAYLYTINKEGFYTDMIELAGIVLFLEKEYHHLIFFYFSLSRTKSIMCLEPII